MNDATSPDELTQLKRELSKLKLEANLRKSLSTQLEAQKKIADQANETLQEVVNDTQTKSMWDEKVYGSVTLKQLIGAHHAGIIDLGIGNR